MESLKLNLKLIEYFPEIKNSYQEQTSWQDGDDTGSHVIYADVFVPFVKEQFIKNNEEKLKYIFLFIEELLKLNDEYITEVLSLSVLEALLFDEDIDNTLFLKFCKPNTLQIINELVQDFEE